MLCTRCAIVAQIVIKRSESQRKKHEVDSLWDVGVEYRYLGQIEPNVSD